MSTNIYYSIIVNLLGILIGSVAIIINFKISSISEPFVKRYRNLMNLGAIIFVLGFLIDFVDFIFNLGTMEMLHHIFLVIALLIFTIAAIRLKKNPKINLKK